MIEKLASARAWTYAGQGIEAKESAVRLEGWSRERRTIVLRRRLKGAVGLSESEPDGAPQLSFVEIGEAAEVYEYAVLVTSLDVETEALGQLHHDRGGGENLFDEMKNQWGWGGYTTHDLARCRLAARLLALFYNWWNIFVRLADPDRHREAIASAVPDGDRDARAPRAANHHPRHQRARQGRARRQGARRRRRLPAGPGRKRGAVDPPANMARHPVARLPGLPQRPPPAPAAAPRPRVTRPKPEISQNAKISDRQTAVFGIN